jgi:hypothetical protein
MVVRYQLRRPYPIPYWTYRLPLLQAIWCNANLSSSDILIFYMQVRCLLYRLNLWLVYRFLPWSLLNPSPTFLSLGCLLVLISCCCPTWPNLMVIFYLVITLERKACVEFKQESHAQLSLAIELCSLVLYFNLRIASLLILNLMTTFTCYLSLYGACSYSPICST